MNNFIRYFVIVISIFLLLPFSVQTIKAQSSDLRDTISLESLLVKARQFAYNNGKDEARKICRQILLRDSTYWDAAVLMGRTYSWDAKYDSARIVLSKVIKAKVGYYDAIDALIDNEYFNENYIKSINYADKGLSDRPNDETFIYKKARALNKSGDSPKAAKLLTQLLEVNPSNKEAEGLLLIIRRESRVNKISFNYGINAFDDSNPWTFSSVSIARKTSGFGSIILRYNYARRFDQDGHQIEIDAYPSIAKGIYVYFNAGISNKKNFPFSRITAEPYFKLPAGFEMSIGVRYLNFDHNRIFALDSNKVLIYTGTVGKYLGNFWFSVRPYFTPGKDGWSKSVYLTVRHYFGNPDNYLSLNLGTGMSPDEQQYAFDPGASYLKSKKVSIDYQQKIAQRFILSCGVGYAREGIQIDTKRTRYSLDLGFSFLF